MNDSGVQVRGRSWTLRSHGMVVKPVRGSTYRYEVPKEVYLKLYATCRCDNVLKHVYTTAVLHILCAVHNARQLRKAYRQRIFEVQGDTMQLATVYSHGKGVAILTLCEENSSVRPGKGSIMPFPYADKPFDTKNSMLLPVTDIPIKTKLKKDAISDYAGCVSATLSPPSPTSTGCLSRLSYHWMTLPTRKHHEPQKVAREPWYTHPLLEAAKPKAPQRVKPMPC